MRGISLQEFEQDPKGCIAEAKAGQRLVLLRGGKAVVDITPIVEFPETISAQTIPAERSAALD